VQKLGKVALKIGGKIALKIDRICTKVACTFYSFGVQIWSEFLRKNVL